MMTEIEYILATKKLEDYIKKDHQGDEYFAIVSALFVNIIRDNVKLAGMTEKEIDGFLDKHLGNLKILIKNTLKVGST